MGNFLLGSDGLDVFDGSGRFYVVEVSARIYLLRICGCCPLVHSGGYLCNIWAQASRPLDHICVHEFKMKRWVSFSMFATLLIAGPLLACWLALRVLNFDPATQRDPWLQSGILTSLVLNFYWLTIYLAFREFGKLSWLFPFALAINSIGVFISYLAFIAVIYA